MLAQAMLENATLLMLDRLYHITVGRNASGCVGGSLCARYTDETSPLSAYTSMGELLRQFY